MLTVWHTRQEAVPSLQGVLAFPPKEERALSQPHFPSPAGRRHHQLPCAPAQLPRAAANHLKTHCSQQRHEAHSVMPHPSGNLKHPPMPAYPVHAHRLLQLQLHRTDTACACPDANTSLAHFPGLINAKIWKKQQNPVLVHRPQLWFVAINFPRAETGISPSFPRRSSTMPSQEEQRTFPGACRSGSGRYCRQCCLVSIFIYGQPAASWTPGWLTRVESG